MQKMQKMRTKVLLFPYHWITKSLYRKIWFCFFITISITVSALGLDYYIQTSSDIKQRAVGNMEQISNQSAATLESYMLNVKNFAWDYFGNKDFQQFVSRMGADPDAYSHYSAKFSQFLTDNPVVDYIMVSQLDGYMLSSGRMNETNELDFDFEPIEKAAVAKDGKGIWVPTHTIDAATNQQVNTLMFAQAVKIINFNIDTPIVGVIYIRLSPEYLKKWLGDIASDEQGNYMLVDSASGQVMLLDHERTDAQLQGLNGLFRFSYGISSRYMFGDDHGVETLFVSNELNNTSWALIGKVPLKVLLEQLNTFALRTLVIGMICLLGAMVIASLLASRIITPLKLLKNGIISIEQGNYEVSVPVTSKDEIGYFIRHFNQMAKEINSLIVKVYETELVKKDAEIKSLQSQINPHFLYNTLGMIDSLASLHEDDRISLISSSLAKMFRYNISGGHMSTLQTEIRQLEIYLSIQQIRFGARLRYSIEIEEGLHATLTPKLLLQPLVENSFIHGIDHLTQGGEIRIQAYSLSETDAAITIWNNGPAIEKQKLAVLQGKLEQCQQLNYSDHTASSIGLFNVLYRIKLVFGSSYGLTVQSSQDQGTTVTVLIKKTRVEEPSYEIASRR
ncbi:sensor histidine kinase [Paenibacillus sp. CF384]|uniref:sensor histidine kinase n=1 Tax=Paenibacillus sp. CF384 TaxID=1884382 RepID=UPI0015A54F4C|nr:sensor histidine kinase [Paenibacillus sp. CF384]